MYNITMKKLNKAQVHARKLLAILGESRVRRYKTFLKVMSSAAGIVLIGYGYLFITKIYPSKVRKKCFEHREVFMPAFWNQSSDLPSLQEDYEDCKAVYEVGLTEDSIKFCRGIFLKRLGFENFTKNINETEKNDRILKNCASTIIPQMEKRKAELEAELKSYKGSLELTKTVISRGDTASIPRLTRLEKIIFDSEMNLKQVVELINSSKK
jgi:hypothetical protein